MAEKSKELDPNEIELISHLVKVRLAQARYEWKLCRMAEGDEQGRTLGNEMQWLEGILEKIDGD